jgi:hypothetical protein
MLFLRNEDLKIIKHIRNEVMTPERQPNRGSDRSDIHQIILQGHLSRHWSNWFDGFTITLDEGGQTILTGPVIDQAALHGLLKKIRDLGLPLISVNRLDSGEEATSQ